MESIVSRSDCVSTFPYQGEILSRWGLNVRVVSLQYAGKTTTVGTVRTAPFTDTGGSSGPLSSGSHTTTPNPFRSAT